MPGAKILPPIVVLELEGCVLVIVVDRESAWDLIEISKLFDHYGADRAMGTLMLRFAIHFKELFEIDRVPVTGLS